MSLCNPKYSEMSSLNIFAVVPFSLLFLIWGYIACLSNFCLRLKMEKSAMCHKMFIPKLRKELFEFGKITNTTEGERLMKEADK